MKERGKNMNNTNRILNNIELIESEYIRKNGTKPNLVVFIGYHLLAVIKLENAYAVDLARFDFINHTIGNYRYVSDCRDSVCKILVIEKEIDIDMEV